MHVTYIRLHAIFQATANVGFVSRGEKTKQGEEAVLSALLNMKPTSAGVCRLKHLGTALSECQSLAELRVSNNALQSLPAELSSNKRLKIIEAGSNNIMDITQVQVHEYTWLRCLH